jgi:hypothetical protein
VIKRVLRRAIDLSATAVICVGLAAPAAAHAWAQPDTATVYSMTPERIAATTAALAGLISAAIGGSGPAPVRPSCW